MSNNVVSVRLDAIDNISPVLARTNTGLGTFKQAIAGVRTSTGQLIGTEFSGAMQRFNQPLTQATEKVGTFRQRLTQMGGALSQQATSFGVATASVWGIYNAYDSLTKVQIRANAAAVRVQTLTTTQHSLTERLRIAQEKGNLTTEQMAVLQERLTDTSAKLNVAQERSADIAQDVQEAWAGFVSTVGPQAVAAGASLIQLGTTMRTSFKDSGGFINTLKGAFSGLFPSLSKAKDLTLSLAGTLGGLPTKVEGATSVFGKLKTALGGVGTGGLLMGAGLVAAGGFLVALAVDSVNTTRRVAELGVELKHLAVGSTAAFQNIAEQARTFNKSLVGQIGGALADNNVTIFGTKSIFNFTEVAKNRLQEDAATLRAEINKGLDSIMTGATATLARDISPTTKSNIDKGIARLRDYLIDSSKKNFATPESTIGTFNVMAPIAAQLQRDLDSLPKLIGGGQVDISGLMTKQATQVQKFAQAIVKDLGGSLKATSVPAQILDSNINLLVQSLVDGVPEAEGLGDAIKSAAKEIIKTGSDLPAVSKNFADISQAAGGAAVDFGKFGKGVALVTAQTDPFNAGMSKGFGVVKQVTKAVDEATRARLTEVATIKTSASAFLGLNAIQGLSVGQIEDFNEVVGKSIIALEDKAVVLRKTAVAEELSNQTTFDAVTANADYIEKMINVNKVNDDSITSYIALRNARIQGLEAAQAFVTQTVLGKEATDLETNALLEEVEAFTKVPDVMHLTVDQLKKVYDAEVQTGEGGKELAKIFQETVLPGITDVFNEIAQAAGGEKVKKSLKGLFKEFDVKHFFKGERGNLEDALVEQFHVDRFADQMNAKLKGVELLITSAKMDDRDADIVANGLMKMINERIAKQPELAAHIKPVQDLIQQVINSDHPLQTLIANFAAIKSGLDESKTPLDDIDKLIAGLPGHTNSAATGVNKLASSFATLVTKGSEAASLLQRAEANFDPSKSRFRPDLTPEPDKSPVIAAPKPIVFPPPNIDAIIKGVGEARKSIATVFDFISKLKLPFQKPNTDGVIKGVGDARKSLATVSDFIIKMKLPFQRPNTDAIIKAVGEARKSIATVQSFISGLKLSFPRPNTDKVIEAVGFVRRALASIPSSKTVTINVKVNQPSGGVPHAKGGLEYRTTPTNSLWGEAGPEIAAFFPLRGTNQPRKGDYDIVVPSPQLDTSGIRNALSGIGGPPIVNNSSGRTGPIRVSITIPVYLAEGLAPLKKFVREVVLDDLGMFAST